MSKPPEPPQAPPPAKLVIGVQKAQGGIILHFQYPYLTSSVIIEEANVLQVIEAMKKAYQEIPRVVL